MQTARIFSADLDGECVIEAESRADGQVELLFVFGLHTIVNSLFVRSRTLFKDRSQRRARVFRIYINATGQNALVRNVGPAQIKTPLDGKMSFLFDLLRDDFAENNLLSEILAADDNAVMTRAGGNKDECGYEQKDAPKTSAGDSAAKVRKSSTHVSHVHMQEREGHGFSRAASQ